MSRHRSLWLREALAAEDGRPARSLRGAERADVVIVGGGYTGLWTALTLRELEPSLDVAIVEADICGGGASGRNGGLLLSWWAKLATLCEVCGDDEGLRLAHAADAAVREIGEFAAAHGIDCHYTHGGWIWAATTPAQVGAWEGALAECERRGVAGAFERLVPAEVARRTGSPTHLAGVLEPNAATVQPALLARGLRRICLEQGIRIYEGSPARTLDRRRPPVVRTAEGVIAAQAVVLATNAWSAALPELASTIAPISSDVVATAPVPERLAEIGWTGGESISNSLMMVDYYRTTRDGRVVFGKGGGRLAAFGRVRHMDRDERLARRTVAALRGLYPNLADVPITDDWQGPVDRTPTGLPVFGALPGAPAVVYGIGFSGNGVGPCRLGGRILASLALGRHDEWSDAGLVQERPKRFPREPLRTLGGNAVRLAVARKEALEGDGRVPGRPVRRLAALAPSGYFKVSHAPAADAERPPSPAERAG